MEISGDRVREYWVGRRLVASPPPPRRRIVGVPSRLTGASVLPREQPERDGYFPRSASVTCERRCASRTMIIATTGSRRSICIRSKPDTTSAGSMS